MSLGLVQIVGNMFYGEGVRFRCYRESCGLVGFLAFIDLAGILLLALGLNVSKDAPEGALGLGIFAIGLCLQAYILRRFYNPQRLNEIVLYSDGFVYSNDDQIQRHVPWDFVAGIIYIYPAPKIRRFVVLLSDDTRLTFSTLWVDRVEDFERAISDSVKKLILPKIIATIDIGGEWNFGSITLTTDEFISERQRIAVQSMVQSQIVEGMFQIFFESNRTIVTRSIALKNIINVSLLVEVIVYINSNIT